VADRLRGSVDASAKDAVRLELRGWAATADGAPVSAVLAYSGRRLAAAGVPTLRRPDVGRGTLGFALALPPGTPAAGLRVFAVSGAVASPIAFWCEPQAPQVVGC
jgi:hypothetical protein